ncbi:thioesterase II family protein [Allorhizobium undicola]|uniref:thioesterase II family protein n=1 Tax=Allorhizobium undicola TaxID=78527 RepID=UPI000688394D|nr:alpha/beta fold hydrolase [Allorhizobium undicola]
MTDLIRPRPLTNPDFRLVVFHHAAGSSSTYFGLSRHMPPNAEMLLLDLPGRGKRHRQRPESTMEGIVGSVLRDLDGFLDRPLALFGHSLGAVIAFEVAAALQARGCPAFWLGVSGRQGPSHVSARRGLQDLPAPALMAELMALGGMPERFLEVPDFLEIVLRNARADFAAIDHYLADPARSPLDLPVTAFAGRQDPWAPPAVMECWGEETTRSFSLHEYDGGHFYFMGQTFPVLADRVMEEIMAAYSARPALCAAVS